MDSYLSSRVSSYQYGERPDTSFARAVKTGEWERQTVTDLGGGVSVTETLVRYPFFDAIEWVRVFRNDGDAPSEVFSRVLDAEATLFLPPDQPYHRTAYLPDPDENVQICSAEGSRSRASDFSSSPVWENSPANLLLSGKVKRFACADARSSETVAPFFRLHRKDRGYVVAIGWTGRWNAEFERTEEGIRFRAGVTDARFFLRPGECVRTASILVMPYEGTNVDGVNRWRRFLKEKISPVGKEGRPDRLPFSVNFWGGMTTAGAMERLATVKKAGLPFDTVWMDAGWAGTSEKDSPDEFEGDWWETTGDWRVNAHHHPDGLKTLRKAIADAGMSFVLWFEPERMRFDKVPITKEHPSYFLGKRVEGEQVLLNLGDPEAWEYIYRTLTKIISELDISVYRQDFNIAPLRFFTENEEKDRTSMTEILYINGLYKLWDALLADHPHLLIDNCASGGRRIDLETLRRSVPLWRSDYQCPANFPVTVSQVHAVSYGTWMPYSGTGTGRLYDTYRFRSSYAPGMGTNYSYSERDTFGDDPEKLEWLRRMGHEYRRVAPFLSCDMYPLTEPTFCSDAICAVQYDRPEEGDGVILFFRRENSPFADVSLPLYGLDPEKTYVFTDADTGKTVSGKGKEWLFAGYPFRTDKPYSSLVVFYEAEKEKN